MMGSAYLYGLAQANLEINAVQGMLMAAFIFVPLYLKERVVTITQFIQKRLGRNVGLAYSIVNLIMLSTLSLGATLFWGAYAADLVFGEYLEFLGQSRLQRAAILIVLLGIFSAIYTYLGGLSAVVRTDIIQFAILTLGGLVVLIAALRELGGWGELYSQVPQLMELHLPADHPKLPWIAIGGMFLLNINYWCANQSVVQRSLAARSLREAQIGLMVGGAMKYFMAVLIVVPGIALAGILAENPLSEPDQAFPYLVKTYLPAGLRGLILCALFASMMSTVDSVFNSLATLWSIDIYKPLIRPNATDAQLVQAGRNTILVTLVSGILMGWMLLFVKLENPEQAFTHTLNELRYYLNTGFVVIICGAALVLAPKHRMAMFSFLLTIPLHLTFQEVFPDMNYFVRAMWVILIAFGVLAATGRGFRPVNDWLTASDDEMKELGWGLLASLAVCHALFW